MRRKDIINEIKVGAFGVGVGVAIFASFLFFGMRAKAATIRDGVHTPVYAELVTEDRAELRALPDYEQSDLDLLAALVWAEAGDQDFIGQRIVADCVINRVRSAEWPGSVADVIYQPGQFSVVANGRLDAGFYNATPENYEAARLALAGDQIDTQVIYFSMYYCANGAFAYQHGDHYIGY